MAPILPPLKTSKGRCTRYRLFAAIWVAWLAGTRPIARGTVRATALASSLTARCWRARRHRATAHAKFTGEIGVCLATSGPGAIHLLNGLYDAKLDHQPVLAIVGQTVQSAIGGDYQQEVDLHSLFKDVAGNYVQVCTTPAQVRHLVDRGVRIALAECCVTCLMCPTTCRS
jgi:glyoxylate carboligase